MEVCIEHWEQFINSQCVGYKYPERHCLMSPQGIITLGLSSVIFFLCISFFYYCSSTFVSIPPPPIPASHPQSYPPLVLSMCPLHMFLKTLPLFLPLSPPISPRVTVSFFLISMSLRIFCLLVCFVD